MPVPECFRLFPQLLLLIVYTLPFPTFANFAKTITVQPGREVNAVTTWYYSNCDSILGVGSYSVNFAPEHGAVRFGQVSGIIPGCPEDSPALPAAAAYYTWMDSSSSATSDYFQLTFSVNGASEVIDVTVQLSQSPPACSITSRTLTSVPGIDDDRTLVGTGEWVELNSPTSVKWDVSSGGGTVTGFLRGIRGEQCATSIVGSPSIVGTQACFTAPYANSSTVITGTLDDGSSCSATFTTQQPTGLIFQRLTAPNYSILRAPFNHYFISMISAVFLTPGSVSFANTGISELDIPNPYIIPIYKPALLTPVAGTLAWLVGCDFDQEHNDGKDIVSEDNYWAFVDPDDNQTRFSLTETQTSHTGVFGNYLFSKGQIQALSSEGTFVSTPGAPAAQLSVPWYAVWPTISIPDRAVCEAQVEAQFPGSLAGKLPAARMKHR